jgi:hypothetical protein
MSWTPPAESLHGNISPNIHVKKRHPVFQSPHINLIKYKHEYISSRTTRGTVIMEWYVHISTQDDLYPDQFLIQDETCSNDTPIGLMIFINLLLGHTTHIKTWGECHKAGSRSYPPYFDRQIRLCDDPPSESHTHIVQPPVSIILHHTEALA